MKCSRCSFTCNAGCQFLQIDGQTICKKCAGTAQLEELAEINYAKKEAQSALFASWKGLAAGESLTFDDYATNAQTRHAMRRFSDCNNVAIQTQPDGSATLQKSLTPCKYGQVAVKNMARGIGDSITAMYAICGIADAGFEVFYYDVHTEWLAGIKHPSVHVINANDCLIPDNAIDLNLRYDDQLREAICRKQWYCKNFMESKGIYEFDVKPAIPAINKSIKNPRDDAGKYVVISPYSNHDERNWKDDKWKAIIATLGAQGIRSVVICSKTQRVTCELAFVGLPHIELQIGKNPDEIAEIILQAKAFIGVDSGMTHYAGLLGVPSVGISTLFGPTLLWSLTGIKGFASNVLPETIAAAVMTL